MLSRLSPPLSDSPPFTSLQPFPSTFTEASLGTMLKPYASLYYFSLSSSCYFAYLESIFCITCFDRSRFCGLWLWIMIMPFDSIDCYGQSINLSSAAYNLASFCVRFSSIVPVSCNSRFFKFWDVFCSFLRIVRGVIYFVASYYMMMLSVLIIRSFTFVSAMHWLMIILVEIWNLVSLNAGNMLF